MKPAIAAVIAAVVAGPALGACAGYTGGAGPASASAAPAASHRVHRDHGHRHGGGHHAGLVAVHDPGRVTGSLTGPCHTRDSGQLPDRSCTPGAIDPAVTQATIASTICRAGYTSTVRPPESQTEAFKWNVAEPAYGQHNVSGELDHLVPLELGGANDAANLWVEAGQIPNRKDAVEYALNRSVCDGRITLRAAQREIATNWIKAAGTLGLRAPSPQGARPSSPGTASGWCTASASYSSRYGDWDVHVRSSQPDQAVTASGGGFAHTWHTGVSGSADVYLRGPSPGQVITVTVGAVHCSTTAG